MPLPSNADIVVVRGFWWDEQTRAGMNATVTATPLPPNSLNPGKVTPNLVDVTAYGHIKTRKWVTTPNAATGYYAFPLIPPDDPDLSAFGGHLLTFEGETPFPIVVDADAPVVEADQAMVDALAAVGWSINLFDDVRAMWLTEAAILSTPAPTPPVAYLTAAQTTSAIATALEEAASLSVPDAEVGVKGRTALMGGTAANPTAPWSKVTGAPAFILPDDLSAKVGDGVMPIAAIDFTTKANGPAPATLDTGQTATSTIAAGKAPRIVNGRLVTDATLPASGTYADYFQAPLGGQGKRIGATWTMPAGADNGNGIMCFALWASVYSSGQVPSSRCHFTIQPGTGALGTWQYWVCNGVNPVFTVKSGTYVNPAADGATRWNAEVLIDEDAGVAHCYLPDGQVVTVTDTEIAARYTALAYSPVVALRDMGGQVAMIEHFANSGAQTAKFPQFTAMWADTALPPRSRRLVTPLGMARALKGLRDNVAQPPLFTSYAPTTALVAATGTSASNVDGTNARLNAVPFGPTGNILIEVDGWYEFPRGADTVFMRMALGVGGTSPLRVALVGASGEKRVFRYVAAATGTPGVTTTMTLQHYSLAGNADLKAGGSGGTMLPPLSIKATPY